MIYCEVRTLWQGKAGLNEERYVIPAEEKRQGITITLLETGEVMVLSRSEVLSSRWGRSAQRFTDKYNRRDYYLVYYEWKPTIKQEVLF